jgi:hypothetical protein
VSISNDAAISFDIIPGSGSGGAMLFDEVQFSINGDLVPIPEPGISHIMYSTTASDSPVRPNSHGTTDSH